jgi:hypothetical protein
LNSENWELIALHLKRDNKLAIVETPEKAIKFGSTEVTEVDKGVLEIRTTLDKITKQIQELEIDIDK